MNYELLNPKDLIGDYLIQSEIGRGGTAVVYRAVQKNPKRDVAIKVLLPHIANSPEMLDRFHQEIDILSNAAHPHILPIYDMGYDQGLYFFVMRYIPEGTLEDLITQHPQGLELWDISNYLTAIGSALSFLHDSNMVHRDLKPSNILVDKNHNPYISDFGIARALAGDSQKITRTGSIVGTPAYMAPEQLVSPSTIDQRADNFALGIMCFEMLTGKLPIDSKTPEEYIFQLASQDLEIFTPLEARYGANLAQIVAKMAHKELASRYQTVQDFVRDFVAEVENLLSAEDSRTQPTRAAFEKYRLMNKIRNPQDNLDAEPVIEPETQEEDSSISEDIPSSQPAPEIKQTAVQKEAQPSPPNFSNKTIHSEPLANKRIRLEVPAPNPVIPAASPLPAAQTPGSNSKKRSVAKEFALKPNASAVAPAVCPVCLAQAHERIPIRIHRLSGADTLAIYFCQRHAQAYRQSSIIYYLAHLALIVLLILSYFVADIFGLMMLLGLYILLWEPLKNLQSKDKREAHNAVQISMKDGRYHFKVAHSRYAKTYLEANHAHIDWGG